MKKILPLFTKVLPLVLLTLIVGCSDDDSKGNNNNDKIVGRWLLTGYTDAATGEYFPETPDPCHSFTMTFEGNGNGNELDKNCNSGDDTYNFTWTANGQNVYTLDYGDNDIEIISVNFEGDKANVTFAGETDIETFTRQ